MEIRGYYLHSSRASKNDLKLKIKFEDGNFFFACQIHTLLSAPLFPKLRGENTSAAVKSENFLSDSMHWDDGGFHGSSK